MPRRLLRHSRVYDSRFSQFTIHRVKFSIPVAAESKVARDHEPNAKERITMPSKKPFDRIIVVMSENQYRSDVMQDPFMKKLASAGWMSRSIERSFIIAKWEMRGGDCP